jgi:predicted cupin superfamily sugar epimerase
MDARSLIEKLGLEPHPEGGYYRETWRSRVQLPGAALPAAYAGERCAGTAIYYLLTPDTFSAFHRVASDEIFHFYRGDPVELWTLASDGSGGCTTLGSEVEKGMHPQAVVPAAAWQGSRLKAGGAYALLGTTVAPGFDFDDFEMATRDVLAAAYPDFAAIVAALTRA